MARSVLYVGRSQRTVSAQLRKALVARDGHCVFPRLPSPRPALRSPPRRPREHGGPTDIVNLALLCVAHHHAVHEGGWTMALRHGATEHETGSWEFTPPPMRKRPLRP
jgi:hypothetical protein